MSSVDGVVYAGDPPPGVERDPSAPLESNTLIGVSAVFFPLAVITTAARIYARVGIVRSMALDDYIMLAAMIVTTLCCAISWHAYSLGLGVHIWNLPLEPTVFPDFTFNQVLSAALFCLATGLAKGSILLFYLRIFPTKGMTWAVWTLFAFTLGYSIASTLVNIFACNPIDGSWNFEVAQTAKCVNRPVFYLCQAGLGILTDFTTVLCPVPALKSLRLPLRLKIGVGVILTMGALVCIISIVRLYSLYVLIDQTDVTYYTEPALMWCILELNLSIIGGNMPGMKPLLARLAPRAFGSSASRSGAGDGYGRSKSSKGFRTTRKHNKIGTATIGGSPFSFAGATGGSRNGEGTNTLHIGADNESEEYIMQDQRIVKTVEYGVDVEEATHSSGAASSDRGHTGIAK